MKDRERLFFACELSQYQTIQKAMEGLRATEAETTFDRYVYFYVLIHKDDVAEFNRRLREVSL